MAGINISQIIETTAPAVPQIYAYTTPEIARHNGWTKIGYTEQDVRKRIKQQTHTAESRASSANPRRNGSRSAVRSPTSSSIDSATPAVYSTRLAPLPTSCAPSNNAL